MSRIPVRTPTERARAFGDKQLNGVIRQAGRVMHKRSMCDERHLKEGLSGCQRFKSYADN